MKLRSASTHRCQRAFPRHALVRRCTTSQTWTIEASSNRLTALSQQTTTTRSNAQGNPVTTEVNAQASYPADAAGNLTTDGLRKFEYDSQNRHSKTGINDADEGAKALYLHNAAGQRVFKSEPQVDYTAPTETTLGTDFITWLKNNFKWLFAAAQANASLGVSYLYGDGPGSGTLPGWALLGEYSNGAATGSGRTEYIWLPTDDAGSGAGAIPIAMFRGSRYYAIHSDHLGTPRLMTDDTAKPVWQWPYSAFGDTKPTGILTATANPNQAMTAAPLLKATAPAAVLNLRFPGQYFDSETNLFYNTNRTYDPIRGSRYTQGDPIGLDGGWNRYSYLDANSLTDIDPWGLQSNKINRFDNMLLGHGGGGAGGGGGGSKSSLGGSRTAANQCPSDLSATLDRIKAGQSFPHRNDGSTFRNNEGLLPRKPEGYCREWVHPTPGVQGPGAQRVVTGRGGEVYYSPDHYRTFLPAP